MSGKQQKKAPNTGRHSMKMVIIIVAERWSGVGWGVAMMKMMGGSSGESAG